VARDSKGRKKRRYGWHRPRWKDPAFWVAVGFAIVLFAVQAIFLVDWSTWLVWPSLAVRAVVTWVLVSVVIKVRVGMRRQLVVGFAEAEQKAAETPAGVSRSEAVARTGGRTLGKAMGTYWKVQSQRDKDKPPE